MKISKTLIIILFAALFIFPFQFANAGKGVFPKNPQSPPVNVRPNVAGSINFDSEKEQPAGSVNSPLESFSGQPEPGLNDLSSKNTVSSSKKFSFNAGWLAIFLIFVFFVVLIFIFYKAKKRIKS